MTRQENVIRAGLEAAMLTKKLIKNDPARVERLMAAIVQEALKVPHVEDASVGFQMLMGIAIRPYVRAILPGYLLPTPMHEAVHDGVALQAFALGILMQRHCPEVLNEWWPDVQPEAK